MSNPPEIVTRRDLQIFIGTLSVDPDKSTEAMEITRDATGTHYILRTSEGSTRESIRLVLNECSVSVIGGGTIEELRPGWHQVDVGLAGARAKIYPELIIPLRPELEASVDKPLAVSNIIDL